MVPTLGGPYRPTSPPRAAGPPGRQGRQAAGLPGLDETTPGRRSFRVYLRHPSDWPRVESLLRDGLLRPADTVQAVQADICREELLMEIEACVDVPPPQDPDQ